MEFSVANTKEEMGKLAAQTAAGFLTAAIAKKGVARLVLSTGASQFAFFDALLSDAPLAQGVDWGKVEVFHLDEYIGLPESHAASFRKYLKERFTSKVALKKAALKAAHFIDGQGDVAGHIAELSAEINKAPVDLAMVGIGENAHIAFNDPPADFDTVESFIVVNLDERCKKQQVSEGWFASVQEVPKQAITMTVFQIMKANAIISVVPGKNKAEAVRDTLCAGKVTPKIPATKLREHNCWHLFLDKESAALLPAANLPAALLPAAKVPAK
ncbi:MAG: 6-phosphogluconolactonase [Spirochaetes bacterium]|nr:6-phosphogluconolactonase [Spirochaetota bacterium]